MITRQGQVPSDETDKSAAKKKVRIDIPTDNAAAQAAKGALEKGGVNVIEKRRMEKQHFVILGAAFAFFLLSVLVSLFVSSSRKGTIAEQQSQIQQLQNRIAMLSETGDAQMQASANTSSTGLDNQQFEHDCDVIGQVVYGMLGWDAGGMEQARDNARTLYALSDAFMTAFYPGDAYTSRVEDFTIYCTRPDAAKREYAVELLWYTRDESEVSTHKCALMLCSVGTDDKVMLTELARVE